MIGASAGGVAALLELAVRLPKAIDAVIGIVLHVGSRHSILPQLLESRGALPAVHPQHGQPLVPGTIYVAPPDHHMTFTADRALLGRGARENHARPAIDPLFRSAALAWCDRAIGVVLTGDLDDGTAGLAAVKQCGGTAIVQDPATAIEPSMPASALRNVAVDFTLPVPEIATTLVQLVGCKAAGPAPAPPAGLLREQALYEGKHVMEALSAAGQPSGLTCPDCGGGLWELTDAKPLRYRCHTGHAFTVRTLENAQTEQADQALFSSVRALQEREMLLRRMAAIAEATGDPAQARAGLEQADRVRDQARLLSRLVEGEINSA